MKRFLHTTSLLGIAILALAAGPALGGTIHVPADYATIQQAVDAAVNGDQVLVAPGVYNGLVAIVNKRIELRSELGPFFTVISGLGLGDVVLRVQDQTPSDDVVISGFTITNADPSRPGISTYGDHDCHVTIENCWVSENPAGGISVSLSATISGCRIFDNQDNPLSNPGGAGIWISLSIEDATVEILDCEIADNDAGDKEGGGIFVGSGDVTISGCTIRDNSASHGGGIFVDGYDRNVVIVNCLIVENTATDGGGGLACELGFDIEAIKTTITRNSAPNASGVWEDGPLWVALTNSIVYDNQDGPDLGLELPILNNLWYSCLPSPWAEAGDHCTSEPPCFFAPAAGDYSLRNSSSCVDAGDNNSVPSWVTSDLDGGPRFRNDQFKADTGNGSAPIVDIGCLERAASGVNPRRYVNAIAGGSNNGRSWANAYTNLQDALDEARTGDVSEIWVVAGTYKPDRSTNDRNARFELVNGVGVYGGFAGTETQRGQREPEVNLTTLSGAIGGNGTGDNSYHVVYANTVFGGTELNGFIVQRGNASGAPIYLQRGGGVYTFNARPLVKLCWIRQNESLEDGAGAYAEIGMPLFVNCLFTQNVSQAAGGGFADHDGATRLYGCLFDGNSADHGGGIKGFASTDLRVVNCTLFANHATIDRGAGMSLGGSGTAAIASTIVFGNDAPVGSRRERNLHAGGSTTLTLDHSCVEGYDGAWGWNGNLTADPRFLDREGLDGIAGTADDNLRLLGTSPCVDSGDDSALPRELTIDLDRNPRVVRANVDMGAFEYGGSFPANVPRPLQSEDGVQR